MNKLRSFYFLFCMMILENEEVIVIYYMLFDNSMFYDM